MSTRSAYTSSSYAYTVTGSDGSNSYGSSNGSEYTYYTHSDNSSGSHMGRGAYDTTGTSSAGTQRYLQASPAQGPYHAPAGMATREAHIAGLKSTLLAMDKVFPRQSNSTASR